MTSNGPAMPGSPPSAVVHSAAPFRPEIEGLRGVAVLAVLLFHAGLPGFAGGYVGVDVFFVISGFLITGSLLPSMAAGTFTYRAFLQRRFWRLAPALLAMMLVVALVALAIGKPDQLERLYAVVVAVLLLGANVHYWRTADYFADDAALDPLLHTWSLSVEEQYYLLYPALLLLLLGKWSRRGGAIGLSVVTMASLLLGDWGAVAHPPAAFFLLPPRAWELGVGGLIAFAVPALSAWRANGHARSSRTGVLAQYAGLAAIVAAVVLFNEQTPFPGRWALVPVLGTALVIAGGLLKGGAASGVDVAPLRWLGRISYSVYLWHQPIFVFSRWMAGGAANTVLAFPLLAVSLIAGYLSWRFVEERFRHGGGAGLRLGGLLRVLPLLVGGIAVAGVWSHGFRSAIYRYRFTAEQRALDDLVRNTRRLPPLFDDGQCRFMATAVDSAFVQRFRSCATRHGPATLVLGDSHARNVYQSLAPTFPNAFVVGVIRTGCRPGSAEPNCPTSDIETFVRAHAQAIARAVFIQSGAYLMTDARGRVDVREIFRPGEPLRVQETNLSATLAHLQHLAAAVPVVWLGPWVQPRLSLLAINHRDDLQVGAAMVERFSALDTLLARRVAAHVPTVRYESLVQAFAVDATFLFDGQCLAFRDEDHLSPCGEQQVAPTLRALVLADSTQPR